MSQTTITTDNIMTIDAANITGAALPALNGAALTNVPGVTNGAGDPLISTNPSGGVGSAWLNTTTGNLFCCTDATAGANVWTNVGSGSGDITPWTFQGTQFGYCVSGTTPTASNVVDKYSYSSDGDADATNADLTVARASTATAKSFTHGYCAGGLQGGSVFNNIDKWAFANNNNATVVGDTLYSAGYQGCASSSTHGYMAGGTNGTAPNNGADNSINKYAFATDGAATDAGDLSQPAKPYTGHSSETHGYVSGSEGSDQDRIDKWPFASDAGGTNIGNITSNRSSSAGCSSTEHGYNVGGYQSVNIIDRFEFASDGSATDWADLATGNSYHGGSSSTTYGYCAGGGEPTLHNNIHKFSFSSQANSTDIGDITVARRYCGGTQV